MDCDACSVVVTAKIICVVSSVAMACQAKVTNVYLNPTLTVTLMVIFCLNGFQGMELCLQTALMVM